jgi:hypothetical protein
MKSHMHKVHAHMQAFNTHVCMHAHAHTHACIQTCVVNSMSIFFFGLAPPAMATKETRQRDAASCSGTRRVLFGTIASTCLSSDASIT